MACNCFKEYDARVKESITKKLGDQIGEIDESRFQHSLWNFGGGDHSPVALNYLFKYFRKRKNGENESRRTTADHLVMMTYCPFCGTKFEGEEKQPEAK